MSDEHCAIAAGDREAEEIPDLLAGYLRPDQVAAATGISERTLKRWHSERRGPPRTLFGRRIYYNAVTFRAWLAAQEEAVAQRGRAA